MISIFFVHDFLFHEIFSPRFSAQALSFADSQDGIMLRAQQEVNAEALSTRLKQEIPSESSSDEDEVSNEQPDWMLKEQLQNSTAVFRFFSLEK